MDNGFHFSTIEIQNIVFKIFPNIYSSQNIIKFALWNSCSHCIFNFNHHLPKLLLEPSFSTHCRGNIHERKPPSFRNTNEHTFGCVENQALWQGPFLEQTNFTPSFASCWVYFWDVKGKNQFKGETNMETNPWKKYSLWCL